MLFRSLRRCHSPFGARHWPMPLFLGDAFPACGVGMLSICRRFFARNAQQFRGEDFAATSALAHQSVRKRPQDASLQRSSLQQNATPSLGDEGFRSGTKGSFGNNMHIWLIRFGRPASLPIACVAEPHGALRASHGIPNRMAKCTAYSRTSPNLLFSLAEA